jgi:hypothetical protein
MATEFWALAMRRQARGEDGKVRLLDWEVITCPRGIPSTLGFRILCETEAEVGGMARFFGPQVGFAPRNGQNDDHYEESLFARGIFSKERVGRPTGRREMIFAEYVAGWRPSFDQIQSGIASPGILHACAWTHAGPPNIQETIAGAAAASRGLG